MPLPSFNEHGLLPVGIHDCTLDELKATFGSFQRSDRRQQLFAKLELFLAEVRVSGIVRRVILNGSFVTAKAEPNDIDFLLVVAADHSFEADLPPHEYNVLSKRRVHRRHGFDVLVARDGSEQYERYVRFFQQIRFEPGRFKGIVSIKL